MLPYPFIALISILIFSFIHLFAEKTRNLEVISKGHFLSFGGGVAIAFVFISLLPKLCKTSPIIEKSMAGVFPYFEKHAYILALTGYLLFFLVNSSIKPIQEKTMFWFSLASYALFNFLIGYSVVDKDDPEVKPLVLFTFAMGLHYFINDYNLNMRFGQVYGHIGKWILILSLFLGWGLGMIYVLPKSAIAMVSAFIVGGVIMNVTRYQLPKETPHSSLAFVVGAFVYAIVLLAIG